MEDRRDDWGIVRIGYGENSIGVPLQLRQYAAWTGPRPLQRSGRPVIRPVIDVEDPTFAELAVARELAERGADWWCWIDAFNQCTFRQGMFNVPAVAPPRDVLHILGRIWAENGGSLRGAWDAFAVMPGGTPAFREVKWSGHDSLRPAQHAFGLAVERAFPGADLAIVEWKLAGPVA